MSQDGEEYLFEEREMPGSESEFQCSFLAI